MPTVAKRRLGRTELEVTPIGLGCWQFSTAVSTKGMAAYWGPVPQADVEAIVRAALDGGISWFDTAELYGRGHSEEALAAALGAAGRKPGDVIVATKWMPIGRTAASIGKTIGARLGHLAPFPIDLHQVHAPYGFSSVATEMKAMADLVAARQIRAVGVSNFSAARMRRAAAALGGRGLVLASNQVQYSLLDRRIEKNGVLAAAKELGVTIIAYSPLAQGILSGRFHDDPGSVKQVGVRKWRPAFGRRGLERSRPVVEALREIAAAHGIRATQVALAWLVQFHGDAVVAIPGASKAPQVGDLADAMHVTLTPAELERLDSVSRPFA